MRVRSATFAVVPVWVANHPAVAESPTRLAVYVRLRIIAFEHDGFSWRSERELAAAIAETVGGSSETLRKHLGALRAAGILGGDGGDLIILNDPPTGSSTGSLADPNRGQIGSATDPLSSLKERDTQSAKRTLPLGGLSRPSRGDRGRAIAAEWYDTIRKRRGTAPTAPSFMAVAKMAEKALSQYDDPLVLTALVTLYEQARPISGQTLDEVLSRRQKQWTSSRYAEKQDYVRRLLSGEAFKQIGGET